MAGPAVPRAGHASAARGRMGAPCTTRCQSPSGAHRSVTDTLVRGRERPPPDLDSTDGQVRHRLRLLGLRARVRQVARALPGVRRVEHDGRGSPARARPGRRPARPGGSAGGGGAPVKPVPLRSVQAPQRPPLLDRHRRARPRAGRRPGAGLAGAAGRLAGHRQVHHHHGHAGQPGRRRAQGALRVGRGVGGPGSPAGRAPRRRRPGGADHRRDRPGHRGGHGRGRGARRVRRRLRAGAARRPAHRRARARWARCGRSRGG